MVISSEQHGFIRGKSALPAICMVSELFNELDKKRYGGNVILKLDISQAYDTLEWSFLFKVMQQFGFSPRVINWVRVILESSNISVLLNGSPHGFFKPTRGVRQGDPLAPFLFSLAEEVLSRGMKMLVNEKKIAPMVSGRATSPSHLLYADDSIFFLNGALKGVKALKRLLEDYQLNSGQLVSQEKSRFFTGAMSLRRSTKIGEVLGMKAGNLPERYLGVPIFKGGVKKQYVSDVIDKIKRRANGWIGNMLSFQGRQVLAQAVLTSIPIHNLGVYKWPARAIKEADRAVRNFIWAGDPNVKKSITVSWKNITLPKQEGGVGIRSLGDINKTLLMKLAWWILNCKDEGAIYMNTKYRKLDGTWLDYYKASAIWPGIKDALPIVYANSILQVCSKSEASAWSSNWCGGTPIAMQWPDAVNWKVYKHKLKDFIQHGEWHIPDFALEAISLSDGLRDPLDIIDQDQDAMVWTATTDGKFSVASAYETIRTKRPVLPWCKVVWSKHVHPNLAAICWRICLNRVPTDERVKRVGVSLASRCRLCQNSEESWNHLFKDCRVTAAVWNWVQSLFGMAMGQFEVLELFQKFMNASSAIRQSWHVVVVSTLVRIWLARNDANFNDKKASIHNIQSSILHDVQLGEALMTGSMYNSVHDLTILKAIGIGCKPKKMRRDQFAIWLPPSTQVIKINTDGSSLGNPGRAGVGIIARDHTSTILFSHWKGIGIRTSYEAEFEAIILALEDAINKDWRDLWIECDNQVVVQQCKDSNFPWWCHAKLNNLITKINSVTFTHIWREGNKAADALAKKGGSLDEASEEYNDGRPSFLNFVEAPYVPYLRCT